MKIRPEQVLLSKQDFEFNKIFVTGSDEILIDYVSKHLIQKFKKKKLPYRYIE